MATTSLFASRLFFLAIGATAGAIIGALWIGPERVGELSPEDMAAIEESSRSQVEAMEEGDFAAWAAAYADEFIVIPPGAPPITDREALSRMAAGFTAQGLALTAEAIEGCHDLAVKRGGYSLTYVPEGPAGPISDAGHYVEIWKRQPDGSWKLSVDIWNSSGAEAAGSQRETY